MISTSALIGFNPMALSRAFSQAGLSVFLTPSMRQAAKSGQVSPVTAISVLPFFSPLIACAVSSFNVPRPAAAKSRAMPRTPKQSGRLGVMPISIIGSFNPNASAAGVPIFGASASSIMPSWSSDRPSSAPEHIMPWLSIPRIFALPSTMPLAGITAPSCAKMPIRPARALGAPHTSFCSPAPLFTVQICKRSASGCGSVARISATSKLAKVSDGSLSASTSSPIRVNLSTISASEAVLSRWACSQERVNFICRSYLSALSAARDLSDRPAARPGTSIGTKP